MKLQNVTDWIQFFSDNKSLVYYVVGAGSRGIVVGRFLNSIGMCWNGYIDQKNYAVDLNGKKVINYDEIVDTTNTIFLISSTEYADQMIGCLLNVGVREEYVLCISDNAYENILKYVFERDDIRVENEKIRKFKNIHKDEKCFLIGNGPSLTIEDLNKLVNQKTFACNSIYRLFEHTKWRPTYYVTHDELQEFEIVKTREDWKKLICDQVKTVFTSVQTRAFYYRDEWKINNIYYYRRIPLIKDMFPFSDDPSKCIYTSGTVAYAMLQLAVYMGFTKIYMLGFDTTYAVEKKLDGSLVYNNVANHNSLMEEDDNCFLMDPLKNNGLYSAVDSMILGYQAARKYADEHNIDIINVTRGGKLNVFERQNYDDVIDEVINKNA